MNWQAMLWGMLGGALSSVAVVLSVVHVATRKLRGMLGLGALGRKPTTLAPRQTTSGGAS